MRDEKVHAVVARSTFPSQNAQKTPGPDHFWKLRCLKSARRCGTKHISKSKCHKTSQNTSRSDHFWKLRCRKSARRCGTKHISKSKCKNTPGPDHGVVARSTFRSQNVQSTPYSDHFWKLRCQKSARRCGAKMREAHFEVKMLKTPHVRATFGRSGVVSRGRRKGLCTLSKVSKT